MLIRDLFIVNKGGLMLYHYKTTAESNYDEVLFSGFVAALSTFTQSLTTSTIDFLKLQDNELHFVTIDEIIVTTIIQTDGGERTIIQTLLHFIGEKFLELYQDLLNTVYEWNNIYNEFTSQIKILLEEQNYEDAKLEIINENFLKTVNKNITPETFHWQVMSLFIRSPPDIVEKAIQIVTSLKNMSNQLNMDPLLELQINGALQKIVDDLSRVLPRRLRTLLVYSPDKKLYDVIYLSTLNFGIFCIEVIQLSNLFSIIDQWAGNNNYDILYINTSISLEDLNILKNLKTNRKIYLWLHDVEPDLPILDNEKENILIVPQLPSANNLLNLIITNA